MGRGRRRRAHPRLRVGYPGQVKVWLTGEIADHYDLEIRTKLLNGSGEWSDPVYVNCSASSPLDINTAPAAGIEPDGADGNKICGMNIHLVRKPQGGRVVREFSKSEDLTVDASWGPGYLSVAAMLGIRTVGKTDRYVWTDRYLGTLVSRGVPVVTTCVEYYADGVEQKDMVYRDLDVEGGDVYTPVDIATQKALKDTCNLDEQYGQNPSTGFSGWFLDPELTQPAAGVTIVKDQTLKLYGRNRCTVRIEYAEGSLRPEDGGIYRHRAARVQARMPAPVSSCPISRSRRKAQARRPGARGHRRRRAGAQGALLGRERHAGETRRGVRHDRRRDMAQIRPGMLDDLGRRHREGFLGHRQARRHALHQVDRGEGRGRREQQGAEREPCRTDRTRTRWEHISANDVISVYRERV